jgi:hypothetical protein
VSGNIFIIQRPYAPTHSIQSVIFQPTSTTNLSQPYIRKDQFTIASPTSLIDFSILLLLSADTSPNVFPLLCPTALSKTTTLFPSRYASSRYSNQVLFGFLK